MTEILFVKKATFDALELQVGNLDTVEANTEEAAGRAQSSVKLANDSARKAKGSANAAGSSETAAGTSETNAAASAVSAEAAQFISELRGQQSIGLNADSQKRAKASQIAAAASVASISQHNLILLSQVFG